MSVSSHSSVQSATEDNRDRSVTLIDQGNNYFVHDDVTYPVLKTVDEELCRSDEVLDEEFRKLIADFDARAAWLLRSGRVSEHFVAQAARNSLLRLSLRAQVERGETRANVNIALLDLEARNQHRPW